MSNEKRTILICDDSPVDRILIRGLLGHDDSLAISECGDGLAAMTHLRKHPVDLVVADLAMPNMNGLELVREIKNNWPLLPVVLVTGFGSEEAAAEALRSGAASYSPKSALACDLARTINFVLDVARHSRPSRNASPKAADQTAASMQTGTAGHFLENDSRLIGPLIEHLQELLPEWSESDRLQIGMAVAEALTNAMHHGNLEISSDLRRDNDTEYHQAIQTRRCQNPWSARRVEITTSVGKDEFRIRVRDEGPGFDQSKIPDPTEPENLSRLCGRGLYLIRSFMDHVQYSGNGNEIEMVKRRSQDSNCAEDN